LFSSFFSWYPFYQCSILKSSQHCRWGLNFCGLMIMCFCGVFFHLGMSQTWMATNLKVEYLLSRQSLTVVVYSSIHTIWYPLQQQNKTHLRLTQISQSDSTYIKLHPYYFLQIIQPMPFNCWRLWAMAEGRVSCSWIGPPRPAFSGLAMEIFGWVQLKWQFFVNIIYIMYMYMICIWYIYIYMICF
jgi:hypothetical protein